MMKSRRKYTGFESRKRNEAISCSEDRILMESAKIASSNAVRISFALCITIKVIKDHQIIAVNPDKSKQVIRKISKPAIDVSLLRRGMVFRKKVIGLKQAPDGSINQLGSSL